MSDISRRTSVTPHLSRPLVGVVVVSFNRAALLSKCIESLVAQTLPPSKVLIVDNGSTDGTHQWFESAAWPSETCIEMKILPENVGGAGGFNAGIAQLVAEGFQWVWVMDDDACPHATAMSELLKVAQNSTNIYGSLAVKGNSTSWATLLLDQDHRLVEVPDDVPASARIQTLPFLGMLIHQDMVARIGLPDEGFFIAADDVEYCLRAVRSGAEIVVAGKSRIEHPKSDTYSVKLLGRSFIFLRLAPWKRYYDTRNRILIAKRYYGLKLLTQTIPGSFIRLSATLIKEPRRAAQLRAFVAGMIDGLLGLKGRRHERWGIRP